MVSPRIWQAGFIVGGSGGNAVVLARGPQSWSGPAFYKLATGSIGLQAGAEAAEMVMLVMSDKALNSLLSTSFKLGGDVSVAAGPVGAGAGAPVAADMIIYTRTKGLYGGLNLSGMVVNQDHYINRIFHEAGDHDLRLEQFDTPYVGVAARILVDPAAPGDLAEVSRLQDQLGLTARAARPFALTAPGIALPTGQGRDHRRTALTALALLPENVA